jgi:tRNA (guanine37-N1)-methyltransferase
MWKESHHCVFFAFDKKTVSKEKKKVCRDICIPCTLLKNHAILFVDLQPINENVMRIDILTVLPEMIEGMIHCSIVQRAQDKGLAEIHLHNLRDYTTDKWRRVDDYPFGGEAGMVIQVEPVDRAVTALKEERAYDDIIYTSPDGEVFNQQMANAMSLSNNLIILCGHYKGVDYRIREHLITREISVGDYVLTGGELAAAVITDAVVRLIPGAIGDEQSALSDSFQDGLLAPPVYTRPAEYKGWKVPDILLSGHQRNIEEWRLQQACERTERLRPDLLP